MAARTRIPPAPVADSGPSAWLRGWLGAALLWLVVSHALGAEALRIGLTPVFLDDQVTFLKDWQAYLEARLERPVAFIQRTSYKEISDLLLRGELDFGWVCGFPYVRHRPAFRLVAVPVYEGAPRYRSYLITGAGDRSIQGWEDLGGRYFAYSDPDSNSGYLYPRYAMAQQGIDPARLLRGAFFAWGHRNVIEAVAVGLADAGAVDGYVWDTLARDRPALTAATRVVHRSPEFGFPPLVAGLAPRVEERRRLAEVLEAMDGDDAGRRLLQALNLDGFTAGDPALFDGIAHMMTQLEPPLDVAR
ncbi:MAG: PhnD/SsuA/transferrin family substrate-binding protein [Gammaproteobacteria bacterium]|nr:PhnD/SsuA/transferrin family substrate-binding protein [Gammaproteobacteria bacterium]